MGSLAPSRFALWREEEKRGRGREGQRDRGREGERERGRERKEGKERRRDGGKKGEEEEESETTQDSIFSCTQYENVQNRNPVTVVSVLKPFCFLKKKKKIVLQWWVPFIQVFWGFSFVPDSESETISSLTGLPRCCHTLLTVRHPLAVLPPLGLLQLGQLAGPLRLACLSLHRVLTHQHIDISFRLCNSNSFQNPIPFCIVPGREMHHVMFCKHSLIRPLRV